MYNAKAYSAASATSPLASTHNPAARSNRTRRADRNPLLRHLPLRPPHGPQRVEQRHAHGLPHRSRPRDRRPGHQGRFRRHQVQAGRPRRRRLPGRLGPHLPQLPGRPRAVLPEPDPHLQLPGQAPRRRHLRRLLRQHRRRRTLRPARSRPTSISPEPRRCSAPGSRPTRPCATGASPRARRSASSVSAGWATWA